MMSADSVLLPVLILLVAAISSSVGQAGASGYLPAMAIVGVAPEVMKPSALLLNILVVAISAVRYYRAGHFAWNLVFPFAISSVPLAFIGGSITIPGSTYKPAIGLILLFAAYRLLVAGSPTAESNVRSPSWPTALLCGAGIGLLSGLTGVGGGIFLSPLLLSMGWATNKDSASACTVFALINSAAALAGDLPSIRVVPVTIGYWALAAAIGGMIGSELGARHLSERTLRPILAVILALAAAKLIVW